MARLATDIFVSILIRQISQAGGNAVVARRGSGEAGAVFVSVWMPETRAHEFYEPAIVDAPQESFIGGRAFRRREATLTELELTEWIEREASFDPDCWLVEIEHCPQPASTYLSVVDDG